MRKVERVKSISLTVLQGLMVLLAASTMFLMACSNPIAGSHGAAQASTNDAAARAVTGPKSGDTSWLKQSNIYQIYPAKFSSTRDLAGITGKIDYLKKLGVKTIWLMPIFEAVNTHGYDTNNYYKIASSYGDAAALKTLVDTAHLADIRIVLDLVINHCGTGNAWLADSDPAKRHDNWYIWSSYDKGWNDAWATINGQPDSSTDHPGATWFKDPYDWLDRDGNGNAHDDDYYYSLFGDSGGATMPDLNWKGARTEITNEVVNIMKYWINQTGVDGFRLDAARYLVENGPGQAADQALTHTIWQDLRAQLTTFAPGAVLIAEAPTDDESGMVPYFGTAFTKEFDSAFHFTFQGKLVGAARDGGYANDFWKKLFDIQGKIPAATTDVLFLANHDAFGGNRVATQMGGDQAKIKLAASLYLTMSGIPALYYGEEYGKENGTSGSADDKLRTDMDWGIVSGQKPDAGSILNHYGSLLTLRNTYDALRGGISFVANSYADGYWTGYTTGGNHMAYVREYYGEKILVVHNFSGHAMNINVDLPSSSLTWAPGTPMTPIMGGGSYEAVSAANQSSYNVGSVAAYATRILFFGNPATKYAAYPTYENTRPINWDGGLFKTNYGSMTLRGTMNGWTSAAMQLTDNYTWTLPLNLAANTTYTFKFDAYGNWAGSTNWGDNAPADLVGDPAGSNISFTTTSAGNYVFTFNDSTRVYSVKGGVTKVATPSFDPPAGNVAAGTIVTVSTATAGCTVYYTTDGSTPTTASASGAADSSVAKVPVNADVTIKAFAVKTGWTPSDATSAKYTIASYTPGLLRVVFKTGANAENVCFPGDANNWSLSANTLNKPAYTTSSFDIVNGVTSGTLVRGNNATALELKLVKNDGTWNNQWSFVNWTKGAGISLGDANRQITITAAANSQVTLTVDVATTTLSVQVLP